MPTLIRLLLVLIVLGLFGFAGMMALTIMVDPAQKDITIKIPPSELVASSAPLDLDNLPAPVNVAPADESSAASGDTSAASTGDGGVKTVDNAGTE